MRIPQIPQINWSRNWLWLAVNGAALLTLLWAVQLIVAAPYSKSLIFATGPSLRVILFTGKSALIFLLLSLACTPTARVLGWRQAISVRKSLGLWGFGFALLHGLYFLQGKSIFFEVAAWQQLGDWIPTIYIPSYLKTPYASYGAMALTLLLPLALTSNRWAMRRMGRAWKWLHRLVYLAVPLAVYHYWQRAVTKKYSLEGVVDFTQPLLFALLVLLLLMLRLPWVRTWTQKRLRHLTHLGRSRPTRHEPVN